MDCIDSYVRCLHGGADICWRDQISAQISADICRYLQIFMKVTYNTIQCYLLEAQLPCLRRRTQIACSPRTDRVRRVCCDRVPARRRCRPGPPPPAGHRHRFRGGVGCRCRSSLSTSFAFVDLILARRVWAVVARDNDRDDNGEGGDPPVPNDAAASGGGDDNNASSRMRSGGRMTDGGGGGIIAGTTTTRRRGGTSLPERRRR